MDDQSANSRALPLSPHPPNLESVPSDDPIASRPIPTRPTHLSENIVLDNYAVRVDSTPTNDPVTGLPIPTRPTHLSEDVRLDRDAVQVFLTTKDHNLVARRVGIAEYASQLKGTMNDESVALGFDMINRRTTASSSQARTSSDSSNFHGAGRTINTPERFARRGQ